MTAPARALNLALLLGVVLGIGNPVAASSLFLGPVPIQHATAGEPFSMDLSRFFELPDTCWTITVAPDGAYEGTVDAATQRLTVRIPGAQPGLHDVMLVADGSACAHNGSRRVNHLTVAAGRRTRHVFSFRPSGPPARAVVAGAFNGWSQDRTVLTDPDGDGVYEAEAWLDPGTYSYKFVVDGNWIADPGNPNSAPDGFGGSNSMLVISGATGGSPAHLYLDTIVHGSASIAVVEGSAALTTVSALLQRAEGGTDTLTWGLRDGRILVDVRSARPGDWIRVAAADEAPRFTNTVRFQPVPSSEFLWQDAVIYFPMTDRFANGDRTNDSPLRHPEILPQANWNGGDWAGIRSRIEDGYFRSLGINALWLAPLNKNPDVAYREYLPPYRVYSGYHGYWPVSPTEPEPRFGTMADLKALTSSARAGGIRVLADAVLNHVHESHPFYREHPEWFSPLLLPDGRRNLRMWDEHSFTTWFEPFLPDIDLDNELAAEAMIDNAAWWTRQLGLDGFRLDAVKHVPPRFWRRFRAGLRDRIERETGRRLYMVGETFMDRHGIMSFVGPNMLDGQFDFPLYDMVMAAFARENAGLEELDGSLAASERIYGKETVMSPLVGNHDKARFMAYADGDLPDPAQPDEEEVGWTKPPRVDDPARYARLKLAQTFILSIDGAPMLYYGDEFGLTGAADPDNRRMMRFGEELSDAERDVMEHWKAAVAVRHAHPALRHGSRRTLLAERDRYAFVRAHLADRVVAIFNRAATPQAFELRVAPEVEDGDYVDLLSGRPARVAGGVLRVTLDGHSSAIVGRGRAARVVTPPAAAATGAAPSAVPSAPRERGPAAAPADYDGPTFGLVTMAGTFNNWNTRDRAFELRKIDRQNAWEIERFFRAGRDKFKFVMDGGWNTHRGLGASGRLEQPGTDIILAIPRAGFYAVVLDLARETWILRPAPATRSVAQIAVDGPALVGRALRLDGAGSIVAEGRAARSWKWTQDAGDEFRMPGLPATTAEPRLVVRPPRVGIYRVTLEVDDGAPSQAETVRLDVAASYAAVLAGGRTRPFSPLGDGTFRAILTGRKGERIPIRVIENFETGTLLGSRRAILATADAVSRSALARGGRPITAVIGRSGRVELRIDPRSRSLEVRPSTAAVFRFDPATALPAGTAVTSVAAAGTFNGWSATSHPLAVQPDGTYELVADLAPGRHQYKFVVNGTTWMADPGSDTALAQADGYGGTNSGIHVGEQGSDHGEPLPGRILASALRHDPSDRDQVVVFARDLADVRLRARAGDLEEATLLVKEGRATRRIAMDRVVTKDGFDWYGAYLPIARGRKSLEYAFEVRDGGSRAWLTAGAAGGQFQATRPRTVAWFRSAVEMTFPTPDWAKHVVWYQIMLDRWRNADPANDKEGATPWTWDWYRPWTAGESRSFYGGDGIWHREYGGDLAGLTESLDYLESLGVTGLYLNPMFEAPGHHKYNTADYRHIDDNFGTRGDIVDAQRSETADSRTWHWTATDRSFLAFLGEARRRGFKVILDGVFNHSGTEFWAFRDLIRNQQNSPYRDWYDVREWNVETTTPDQVPFRYEGWAGFAGLPEFAENDRGLKPGIREHILDIARRWGDPDGDGDPSDGIDGWRLDVPENVHERFWRDFRATVKDVNPEAYIVGEIWDNASNRLQGDHHDAVMNYEFLKRVHAFFLPGGATPALKPTEFARSFEELLSWYPPQVNYVLQNLLGSHDVDRIASAIRNRAGWKRGRIQDDNPAYSPEPPTDADYEVLKQVAAFQMTWLGAPLVYYGDELGMYGADDPTNRMPMWWPDSMPYDNPSYRVRTDLLETFRSLIAIRNTFPALRTGRARFVAADDEAGIVAFERSDARDRILVAFNIGTTPRAVTLPAEQGSRWAELAGAAVDPDRRAVVAGIGSRRAVVDPSRAPVLVAGPDGLTARVRAGGWVILVKAAGPADS